MNREQAKETVKQYLEDYLQQKGINTRKPFTCLNPEHDDRHPSMSLDRKHNRVHCFSCGASYDIFDLIALDEHCSQAEAFTKAYQMYGITIDESKNAAPIRPAKPQPEQHGPDLTGEIKAAESNLDQISGYLAERGISMEIARQYHLGYFPAFYTQNTEDNGQQSAAVWRVLVIPTSSESYICRNIDSEATHKNRYRKKGADHLFHAEIAFYPSQKPIWIVEGQLDALSILQAGGQAIALGSTANGTMFINYLELAGNNDDLRNSAKKNSYVIALDNDPVGKSAGKELEKMLLQAGYTCCHYNPYGICKDANEALITNAEGLRQEIQQDFETIQTEGRRKEYMLNSAAAHLPEFLGGIAASVNTPAISTGFYNLDTILDGGLYEGLYIIGAISSLGKTTLCLQLGDQLAQAGHDVLIFSLEMARSELMAKSISRLTFMQTLKDKTDSSNAKTARGITDGARYGKYNMYEKKLIQQAYQQYKSYADHIFIIEGMGDIGVKQIRSQVEKHVQATGNKPVVIVDYLQILAPDNVKATDKQNTDKAVLELKRISRDFKTPVICISSFNRDSYKSSSSNKGAVTMTDFKESGAIEYSSDILIGLQFRSGGDGSYNEKEEKRKNPREIKLVILKNRNGEAFTECSFNYYKLFNYYEEA